MAGWNPTSASTEQIEADTQNLSKGVLELTSIYIESSPTM